MGFAVGETVGPYKITAHIGQGGMATIFKAHQTTLERDVALKVMHPALKEDPSFLMRLKREAAIVAKLNHPSIVTVYDFGEFEGVPYLVMRFIEGRTLKAVLQKGRLTTPEILSIARPIGDALIYAHAHGVLHRDVKPSNILIDGEGHAYLTDFGLARIIESAESTSSQDMLIGSPHYLSPEQAKSETVDVRTDIYSFGIVLYEMFTGRVPFSGDTPYATILAQIKDPPAPPRSISPQVPRAVEQVLLKALAKEPKGRYASVREMMGALENATRGPHEAGEREETAAAVVSKDTKPARTPALRASLSGMGNKLKSAAASTGDNSNKRTRWVAIVVSLLAALALFLCGTGVVLVALQTPLLSAINLRRGTAALMTPVAGQVATATPAAVATTVEPPPATPAPTRVAATSTPPAPTVRAPVSSADLVRGTLAFTVASGSAAELHSIWIADADGSDPHPVIDVAMWPAISPDGRQIAYYRIKDAGLYLASIDGTNPRRILAGDICCIQWSPDSKKLLFFKGNLKLGDGKIYTLNIDGSNLAELTHGFNPSWAPDGNRITFADCQPNTTQCGLYIFDLKAKGATMITRDSGANPQWSPHGDKIVYQADDGKGHVNVFVVNADGTGIKQLTFGKKNDGQPVWSRDGNFVFWRSDQGGAGWAIYGMRGDGSGARLLIDKVPPDSDLWARESLSAGP